MNSMRINRYKNNVFIVLVVGMDVVVNGVWSHSFLRSDFGAETIGQLDTNFGAQNEKRYGGFVGPSKSPFFMLTLW